MPNDITVAIDGYSGVGKSSTAKAVAQQLGYTYVDSGAMYRAVTLHFLRNGVELDNPTAVAQALANLRIGFQPHSRGIGYETLLNGENVEQEIRGMQVSDHVSPVSALPVVRHAMVGVATAARSGAAGGDGRPRHWHPCVSSGRTKGIYDGRPDRSGPAAAG